MPQEDATVGSNAREPAPHRILIVDDRPELRLLLRARLEFEPDLHAVGEASNGAEAVRLARTLVPSAVVLDLEMPVMRGDEAIPLLRAAAPGMGILLYTGVEESTFAEDATPDAIVRKGASMTELVTQLRAVLERAPFDVMRLELGTLPLRDAISAFDTWAGLNVRVLEALERGDVLAGDQLSGASREELEALMGVYLHIGHNLQRAARAGSDEATPVIHIVRATGVLARAALLAFDDDGVTGFWKAWGYEVPAEAKTALALMRERLISVLPASSGEAQPDDARSENG